MMCSVGRLSCANDLHAKDAVYHQQYNTNFQIGKNIPMRFQLKDLPQEKKPRLSYGCPLEQEKYNAFKFTI